MIKKEGGHHNGKVHVNDSSAYNNIFV